MQTYRDALKLVMTCCQHIEEDQNQDTEQLYCGTVNLNLNQDTEQL